MRCVSAYKAGVVGSDDPGIVDYVFVCADADFAGTDVSD